LLANVRGLLQTWPATRKSSLQLAIPNIRTPGSAVLTDTDPENAKGRNMGAIIGWIIFGLIAGAIAKLLMPGRDPGGFVVTCLLGIAGAVVGGFIGRALWGSSGVNDWSLGSFLLAIVGAIALLAIYRMIIGRRRGSVSDIGRRAA
jgi:uncharacterized membrane protein YeaQ/YmgE (transglycosylase-associated protein family)